MRDESVVERVQAGDRDAYRTLVERYTAMVFGVAGRYGRDEAETEDLAQDIFIQAYMGLSGFRGDATFSSWLYRIAVNRCRDHVKSARMAREEPLERRDSDEGHPPSESMRSERTPESELEARASAARLRSALEALDPTYAVPFLLKYDQGLSYEEMAERLDVTAGALKVRVHRARKALRDLLGERP